jgi:sodium/pantothenate symporter
LNLTPVPIPVLLAAGSNAALVTFLVYTAAVLGLAAMSNRLLKHKSFVSEYFLGSRGLGMWAFALTFAATSASGGSFTGFPAKIYSHGWILGLWIASYMVVPLCAMGLLGKRLNQVARTAGAITVPDVLRDRFESKTFGLVAVTLIVFFMSFNLVAQFKAGSLILQILLADVTIYQQAAQWLGGITHDIEWLRNIDPGYLLCLVGFGVAVIVYTTYGGFHAVVWTDVMQGVVMVLGVLIMLPLALSLVGGLDFATRQMAEMIPPRTGTATLRWTEPPTSSTRPINAGDWLVDPQPGDELPRLFKVLKPVKLTPGQREVERVAVLEILTPGDRHTVLQDTGQGKIRRELQVVAAQIPPPAAADSAFDGRGVYVTGPGPHPASHDGFLPLSLAVSFFFMWAISGAGQPSSMVRLMAFKDSQTLRRAIFTVAMYYSLIYFPLVLIFCCSRVLMPGMDQEADSIMPTMAVYLTSRTGVPWLAGLLIAAPFAAVMSTVDSFLLMTSSALVRDIYQRNMNPHASVRTIKYLSYLATLLVGVVAAIGAINPPEFLQDIIVYVGSGLSACFLAPMVFAIYWPRSNKAGCLAGMLAGFAAHLAMYVGGIFAHGSFFRPYRVLDFDPIIIGLAVSFCTTYLVTRITPPPPEHLVRKYFFKHP